MSATRCTCPWQVVQVHPDVESVLLRAETDPHCPFPHAEAPAAGV